ncbi:MAG: hypothetical protein ACI8PD_001411 [Nitrospinales bacterium]|jgi:hypothetical protein
MIEGVAKNILQMKPQYRINKRPVIKPKSNDTLNQNNKSIGPGIVLTFAEEA